MVAVIENSTNLEVEPFCLLSDSQSNDDNSGSDSDSNKDRIPVKLPAAKISKPRFSLNIGPSSHSDSDSDSDNVDWRRNSENDDCSTLPPAIKQSTTLWGRETHSHKKSVQQVATIGAPSIPSQDVAKINSGGSTSSRDLKSHVFRAPLMAMEDMCCNPLKCQYGGKCIQQCALGDVFMIRNDFWGECLAAPPSASQRSDKISKILTEAYHRNTDQFAFKIGPNLVCEKAYLSVLGKCCVCYACY